MELYYKGNEFELYNGNMLDMEEVIAPNSIESIVTDPPYELNFMGKGWDSSGIAFQSGTWKRCLDVLKPGGYLLAFGGSRTFHRIACAIEDAGFEIRDTIMWLYGSGFPKSMNIGLALDKKNGVESPVVGQNEAILKKQASDIREGHRKILDSYDSGAPERNNGFKTVSADIREAQNEWKGWGTALKPSYEPIIVARKPCEGSCVDNVMKYGVGGLNIDECRVEFSNGEANSSIDRYKSTPQKGNNGWEHKNRGANFNENTINSMNLGRFPANTILTYDDSDFEEVCGGFPVGKKNGSIHKNYERKNIVFGEYGECNTFEAYDDEGSAARYFYCAKASKRDRDEGLDAFVEKPVAASNQAKAELKRGNTEFAKTNDVTWSGIQHRKNTHPTVKPTSLMQYLVRLVTPNGGTVLDPFNGSGSTGKAVMCENRDNNKEYKYIGIEMTEEYLPISKARIEYVIGMKNISEKDNVENYQIDIFDLLGE